jgi:hypothetical protein
MTKKKKYKRTNNDDNCPILLGKITYFSFCFSVFCSFVSFVSVFYFCAALLYWDMESDKMNRRYNLPQTHPNILKARSESRIKIKDSMLIPYPNKEELRKNKRRKQKRRKNKKRKNRRKNKLFLSEVDCSVYSFYHNLPDLRGFRL